MKLKKTGKIITVMVAATALIASLVNDKKNKDKYAFVSNELLKPRCWIDQHNMKWLWRGPLLLHNLQQRYRA